MKKNIKNLASFSMDHKTKLNYEEQLEVETRIREFNENLNPDLQIQRPLWLLSDWSDAVWTTYAGKKTRMVNGEWVGAILINWDLKLPDGARLTDKKYSKLLAACKQIAVLYRNGINQEYVPSLTTWTGIPYELKRLSGWLVLNEARYFPENYAFALLDQAAVNQIMSSIGRGGWSEANSVGERIVGALYQKAFQEEMPIHFFDNVSELDILTRDSIIEWIKLNDGYHKSGRKNGLIKRNLLADLTSTNRKNITGSVKVNAILRQFEPELRHPKKLLVAADCRREYPSHRTQTVQEVLELPMGESPVKLAKRMFSILVSYHQQLPTLLPSPKHINLIEAKKIGLFYATNTKYTRFVPTPIGFAYLQNATSWINEFGDGIVEYYLSMIENTIGMTSTFGAPSHWTRDQCDDLLKRISIPESLQGSRIDFDKFRHPNKYLDFDAMRASPSIHTAVEILIGASVVAIGMLVPSRISEITNLRRDCLIGDGPYWIRSDLAKKGVAEYRGESRGKPVPNVVAKAIKQLQKLGDGLAKLNSDHDKFQSGQLFYIPSMEFGSVKSNHASILNDPIDRFCDYVGLAPDRLGRRWYIRLHEMRKWFLLLFFWSARFNVSDAARDIAGHTDAKHLQAYINQNFPAMELSTLEAEYSVDRLRHFDRSKESHAGELGLNELYEKVLNRFGVKQFEFIPERQWENYVADLRSENEFVLEPYMFSVEGQAQEFCVAFKSSRRESE